MVEATSSLLELVGALEALDVSARELLEQHLDRIERLDGPINSVVTLEPTRAHAEAAAIDQARAAGRSVGRLAGVPVTIKDAIATAGIRSTGGAVELHDHIPDEDATVVARIRDAGAVVFAKTNVPRWSGDYQTYNELFGTTNNPWDLERTPGGSSGGPAAAVAMGFTGFEIGTDIGGSIRVPSSFCGVYGHKPSFGIIPTYGYLDNAIFHRSVADINVFGPIARSVDDLELLLELLAAPNPDDAVGWRLDLPPARGRDIGDFRVAAWLDDEFAPVDPAVAAVMLDAIAALERAGARIDHDRRPDVDPTAASRDGLALISSGRSPASRCRAVRHPRNDALRPPGPERARARRGSPRWRSPARRHRGTTPPTRPESRGRRSWPSLHRMRLQFRVRRSIRPVHRAPGRADWSTSRRSRQLGRAWDRWFRSPSPNRRRSW
jgi:Asp-tRNA(Asn)/Glu-tRNA(Gln) amidotransferase A subunit family amidase